jgi:hypothetical protein
MSLFLVTAGADVESERTMDRAGTVCTGSRQQKEISDEEMMADVTLLKLKSAACSGG